MASAMPSDPSATCSISRGPGSELNTMSHASATALGLSAGCAPRLTMRARVRRLHVEHQHVVAGLDQVAAHRRANVSRPRQIQVASRFPFRRQNFSVRPAPYGSVKAPIVHRPKGTLKVGQRTRRGLTLPPPLARVSRARICRPVSRQPNQESVMNSAPASKEAVVLKLLAEGDTMLCLDARHPDACVPPHQSRNPALRLILNRNFPRPIDVTGGGYRRQPVVRRTAIRMLYPHGGAVGRLQSAHHGRRPCGRKAPHPRCWRVSRRSCN